MAFRVKCLCLAVLVSCCLADQSDTSCEDEEICVGGRPQINGCCPALPGETCRATTGRECDDGLGYRCVEGICTGFYDLSVIDVSNTQIILEWEAFAPVDYKFEYSVLFTKTYSNDESVWQRHEFGLSTRVTLSGLDANTLYFVRVGVWDNPFEGVYRNLSEVIMAQTEAAAFCVYGVDTYLPNQEVLIPCEELCVCGEDGEFHCEPLCPEDDRLVDPRYSCLVDFLNVTDEECCLDITCTNTQAAACEYNGEKVDDSVRWTIGCEETCVCNSGTVTCHPLCEQVLEPEDCREPVFKKVANECCGTWECLDTNATCFIGSHIYSKDEVYLNDRCEFCRCSNTDPGDCISLTKCPRTMTQLPEAICTEPVLVHDKCCPHVVCQDSESDVEEFIEDISALSLSSNSLTVHFTLKTKQLEQRLERLFLFYTDAVNNSRTQKWTENEYTNHSIQTVEVQGQTLSKTLLEAGIYRIGNEYFVTCSPVQPGKRHFLKVRFSVRDDTSALQILNSHIMSLSTKGNPVLLSSVKVKAEAFLVTKNISSHSMVLVWQIPNKFLTQSINLFVRYKTLPEVSWTYTSALDSTQKKVELRDLRHSAYYICQIVLKRENSSEKILAEGFFQTLNVGTELNFSLQIFSVSFNSTFATLQWTKLSASIQNSIVLLEICWKDSTKNENRAMMKKNSSEYSIGNLKPATLYTCWLNALLNDGSVVTSSVTHFVTKEINDQLIKKASSKGMVVICVSVTLAVVFASVLILIVYCVKRCKSKRSKPYTVTSFENQIFQIQLQHETEPS